MEAQSTSFVPAINMSQWKSNDMPQNSWLNGGNRWNMDSNVNEESNNQSSDWGAKGGPNGLSLMDQKKNGWPAISSANSNGLKQSDVIPGDVSSMNGSGSGSSLLSSDQNQGQRNGTFAGESSTMGGSIWGSGSPGWGGIQTSAGSDKPEAVSSSFNQGLQGVRGMQSTNSGNPWGQGPTKSPLTSESNISLSSAPSSSGVTFTTSSASSNSNTHWSGSNSQGQDENPQERENSPLAKPEVSEESNFPNSSTATSTTSSVSSASDTSTVTGDSNKSTNSSNAQSQQENVTGKNGWEGDGSAWNSQSSGSQGMDSAHGWGSATPTSAGPSGWGNSSTPGAGSGWGSLPPENDDKSVSTGWGQAEKVEDQESLGTEIWGSKSDGPATQSAWGKPLGAPATRPSNQWGTKPNPAPNQQPQGGRGWGPFPSAGNGGQSGWTDAPVAAKLPSAAWGDANNQGMRSGMKEDGLGGSTTQWGKMPINQGTKWDVDSDAKGHKPDVDNGTAVWSGQHQNAPRPPPNAWNKEPPKSPWGNPVQQSKPPQPDSAWGAPPNANKAWGNPDEPSSKQAWGQPQQSQWNQSGNPDNRNSTSSAWGGNAPPTTKPPSSRSGPSSNSYGSWNKDDNEGKKQQSYQQDSLPQSVSACAGWLPILDIPQEIVPTGWGQLSPHDPSKPFGIDDGTYVWGDSKEHNAWVTEMSAKNVLRMKQLKQKAAAAATAGGNSTMQSPSVPSSKPPSTPSSEDSVPVGFSGADQKKTGWDEPGTPNSTSTSRPKNESESGGEWQNLPRTPSEEHNKWGNDNQHSSSWGSNTRSSTQSRESMQTWNEDSTNISSSIGHWGDDDWDGGSQNSDGSSGVGRRKLSVHDNNANRNPSQVALKLRALMERGFSKEDAEMMLKKHNMNLESAFEELSPGQDPLKSASDIDLQFSNMKLQSGAGSGDMSSNFSMNMMQNMRNKGMNNLGAVGGPGFHGQGPPNQRMPQQKFQGQMGSGNNQPLRGNFNPMQQQQQQQQQQQLLQAMAAGMNQNSQIPQQLLHALQQNPQLLAQLQNMQGGNSGKQGYMNRPDFFRNQFMPQNQGGQSRPRAPFSSSRPMMQGDADMNNPNFLSGAGFGQDMGHQPQQSRMEQFFSKQQRQQQQQQQNRSFNRHPGNLPKPMRADDNNSRSTSPAASDSMPNSADSAFSDSSVWPFSQPSVDDQGDGVPEFKPGVPWKPRTFDVANDPDATPGSVGSLSSTLSVGKTPGREREKHDDLNGILMRPMKPPHGPSSHQVWGQGNRRSQSTSGGWNYQDSSSVFQRQQSLPGFGSRPNRPGPPPGLENNPRNSNWNRAGSWDAGSWSGNDGMSGASNWLVLRNVGNVDSSYLHLLCRHHGVVEQFNLNQAQGMALVAYKNREDAMKARQTLNSLNLGISANYVNPNEIGALVGGGGSTTGGSQWSNGQNKLWDDGGMHNSQSQWNGGGLGGVGLPGMQGSLWSPGPMGGGGGIGGWGGSDMPMTPNLPLLPEDLLN